MDNENIISHLLNIEAQAAALINDAQTEAARRTAEGEQKNRAALDLQYKKEASGAEAEYLSCAEKIRERCSRELLTYQKKLESLTVDTKCFNGLLDSLFFGEN